jgi:hypothetical protein
MQTLSRRVVPEVAWLLLRNWTRGVHSRTTADGWDPVVSIEFVCLID